MGAAASITSHPVCSAAAAVCPPVGLAAGVFGAGVALGATAAACPPVGVAAVFGAGVALWAASRVKAATPDAVTTDLDALCAVASAAATGCLRVVTNAARSAFEGAERFARSACRRGRKDGGAGAERSSPAKNKEEPLAATLDRQMVMAMEHRAPQHAGHGFWTAVLSEAALFDVAGGNAPCQRPSAAASQSELLAARAAWRASEVMAALETLKPLEEKLGASIPREAKSCICVMAAAAGVCLDVFKPPTGGGGGHVWDSGLRSRGGAVAEPWLRGHGASNRRRCSSSRFIDFSSHM